MMTSGGVIVIAMAVPAIVEQTNEFSVAFEKLRLFRFMYSLSGSNVANCAPLPKAARGILPNKRRENPFESDLTPNQIIFQYRNEISF